LYYVDESDDAGVAKQQKVKLTADDYREKLLSKTCPLWNMSYDDQLKVLYTISYVLYKVIYYLL